MLTAIFLLINGPGRWSLDALLGKREEKSTAQLAATLPRKASENASVMV